MKNRALILVLTIVLAFTATSCSAESIPSTEPQRPQPGDGQPQTPQPPPPMPGTPAPPPLTPEQIGLPAGQPSLFKFVRTVEVVPDDQFTNGAFARVNYVPATDRMVVTFGGRLSQPFGECQGAGHGYKEYTQDMEPTGKSGMLNCEIADLGSVMVDDFLYDVSMRPAGWRIMKFDAVTWTVLADIDFPLDMPREANADPMAAFVNGMLDVSSGYYETGEPPMGPGTGSHHHLFSADLKLLDEKILNDTPHIHGSSMIYVNGVYYFITATSYDGDLTVMSYDKDWRYLGKKDLIRQAHFSTGVADDGSRFYLAYTDTSQRTTPGFLPVYMNVHLAAFDREWNLLDDVAVTNYPASEKKIATRAWVTLHDNRLYVSYDQEGSADGEKVAGFVAGSAFVSVYELTQ